MLQSVRYIGSTLPQGLLSTVCISPCGVGLVLRLEGPNPRELASVHLRWSEPYWGLSISSVTGAGAPRNPTGAVEYYLVFLPQEPPHKTSLFSTVPT